MTDFSVAIPGDIYLVRSNTWRGKLIRFWTRSRYNHAGIITGQDVGVEARGDGLTMVFVSDVYSEAEVTILTPSKPLVESEISAIRDVCAEELFNNDGYDWWGILGFLFFKRWQNPGKWYCFEFVYHVYDKIGRRLGRVDRPEFIDGSTIFFSNELEVRDDNVQNP